MNSIDLDTVYVKPYGTDQFIIVAENVFDKAEMNLKSDTNDVAYDGIFVKKYAYNPYYPLVIFNCKDEAIRVARIIKQRYIDQEEETKLNTWVTVQHMIDNPPVKI